MHLKRDGTRVFRQNRRVHLNRQGASVHSTTGSRDVRISGSNAGYTTFRGSVNSTGYPLHSPVSPSLPLPCVTVCHHISTGFYFWCQHVNDGLPYVSLKKTRSAALYYNQHCTDESWHAYRHRPDAAPIPPKRGRSTTGSFTLQAGPSRAEPSRAEPNRT